MKTYKPKYGADKIEKLRRYVENFKRKVEKKSASVFTESLRTLISKLPSDGDARYTFFNNLFFDGELPKDVKVYIIDAKKNKSRSTGFDTEERRNSYKDMYNTSKDPNDRTLGAWYYDSRAIYIFVDRLNYNDFVIDTVLVHEMCHVWQDCVYYKDTDRNESMHGYAFQLSKRRTQRRSKGIYDGGAKIDTRLKEIDYNNGRYGNPTLGRTKFQVNQYYKKRINVELGVLQPGLKINNIETKEFTFDKNKFFFTGKHFLFKSEPNTQIKFNMRMLNNNKELIEFLIDSFSRIKDNKGL